MMTSEERYLNTFAFAEIGLIKKASGEFGSSSIVVSIDVKKRMFGKQQVYVCSGTKATGLDAVEYAQRIASKGAGEIIINSIDRDGTMEGYDLELIKRVANSVDIPVVALGGAGSLNDLKMAVEVGNSSAVAAGSLFVFRGNRNAVLINFPSRKELLELFRKQE